MIAKISHGSSLYGVLAYNQLKVDERHADVLFTSRIIEPQGDNPLHDRASFPLVRRLFDRQP